MTATDRPAPATAAPTPGPVLFARYAYPPNALGLCGPDDHQALLEYGTEGVTDRGLVALARGFDGAWPYLELLATAVGAPDPLDRAVVESYWLGGPAADAVAPGALAASLDARFRRRAGRNWDRVRAAVVAGLPVCHAFHVFAVYPWAGLLRGGAAAQAVHVLDRCRIRWGELLGVENDTAIVRSRHLEWDGAALTLGPPVTETATWQVGGRGFVRAPVPGEVVALHWDWVCDRLTPRRLARLQADTAAHLRFVNTPEPSSPGPGPRPPLVPVFGA